MCNLNIDGYLNYIYAKSNRRMSQERIDIVADVLTSLEKEINRTSPYSYTVNLILNDFAAFCKVFKTQLMSCGIPATAATQLVKDFRTWAITSSY